MDKARITRIEAATLTGKRPRQAGCNARISVHGLEVAVPLLRLTTDDGASGFGRASITEADAAAFLGADLSDLIALPQGVADSASAIEFPLWDLLGQRMGQPVYQLVAKDESLDEPVRVPCYDTSLYIDDLHLNTQEAGAALIAEEARYGYERGHRAFKIKVGRGARHMPLEAGTARDIAVIKAVRAAVGDQAAIMIDANNGYNLNIAKRVLAETADCRLFWLEEAFHEDAALYEDLQDWLSKEGMETLIADGEGGAPPGLMDWARTGLVDVIQYDIFSHGFSAWLRTGALLDDWGARAAPHHYGAHVGNYVSGHLATAVAGFTFVEWDEVDTPGLDGSAYKVESGKVTLPRRPGFGLELDEARYREAVAAGGFELRL